MFHMVVDDNSLRHDPPLRIGCFELDDYEKIKQAKNVMMEGLIKKNGMLRCTTVYPSDVHQFFKSPERKEEAYYGRGIKTRFESRDLENAG